MIDRRNRALDGLRGLAAFAVAIFHCILCLDVGAAVINRVLLQPIWVLGGWHDAAAKAILVLLNGETAVMIFFVISGTVLAASLDRAPHLDFEVAYRFVVHRVFRIYPAMVVCLVGFFAMHYALHWLLPEAYLGWFTWRMLFGNLALIDTSMHGATWTLQAEMLAVPIILLTCAVRRAFGFALVFAAAIGALIVDNHPAFLHITSLEESLLGFMFGIIVAQPEVREIARRARPGLWLVFLAGTLLVRHIVPHASSSGAVCHGLFAACTVACVYYGQPSTVLLRPSIQTLGRISYSFYLIAAIAMNAFWPLMSYLIGPAFFEHFLEYGLLLAVPTIGLAIPLSIWSERYIERPFIELGRRVTQGRGQAGPISSARIPASHTPIALRHQKS